MNHCTWRWFGLLLIACFCTTRQAWPIQASSAPQENQAEKSSTDAKKAENSTGADEGQPKIYEIGKDVTPPKALEHPDPEYTQAARQAKVQGVVVLKMIVDEEGRPRNVQVADSLRQDLDQKALDAVRKWRFQPAMKDGHAVAVKIEVQVNFRLY